MIENDEDVRELCLPELEPNRVVLLANRYELPVEAVVFTLREYDSAVAEDPLGHEHFRMVAEALETDEDLVGHIVTEYMEAGQVAGAGKTNR